MIGNKVIGMFHCLFNSLSPDICCVFRYTLFLLCGPLGRQNHQVEKLLAAWHLKLGVDFWLKLGDPFVSQGWRESFMLHFLEQILVCAFVRMVKIVGF